MSENPDTTNSDLPKEGQVQGTTTIKTPEDFFEWLKRKVIPDKRNYHPKKLLLPGFLVVLPFILILRFGAWIDQVVIDFATGFWVPVPEGLIGVLTRYGFVAACAMALGALTILVSNRKIGKWQERLYGWFERNAFLIKYAFIITKKIKEFVTSPKGAFKTVVLVEESPGVVRLMIYGDSHKKMHSGIWPSSPAPTQSYPLFWHSDKVIQTAEVPSTDLGPLGIENGMMSFLEATELIATFGGSIPESMKPLLEAAEKYFEDYKGKQEAEAKEKAELLELLRQVAGGKGAIGLSEAALTPLIQRIVKETLDAEAS